MQGGGPTARGWKLVRGELWHIGATRAMIDSRELARGNIVTRRKLRVLETKALFGFLLRKLFENWLESDTQDKETEENVTFIVFRTFHRQISPRVPTLWNCTRSMELGYLGPREERMSRGRFHGAVPPMFVSSKLVGYSSLCTSPLPPLRADASFKSCELWQGTEKLKTARTAKQCCRLMIELVIVARGWKTEGFQHNLWAVGAIPSGAPIESN